MDLTVAICTYNRLEPLRGTLDSLAECEPADRAWELLIVDNGVGAAIEALVDEYTGRLPVRYVPEPTLGTSHARNRAVREATAPVILFTDDDVTFDRQWLSRMSTAIAVEPDCAFWGGRVEPVWGRPIPAWFDEHACKSLGDTIVQYRRGDDSRTWDAHHDPPFYTANLALRVDAIERAGLFDTTVGHRGARRMGMEDSLMVRAISDAGGVGWYAADAVVFHPVPAERATRRYARQFAWRQGWLSARTAWRNNDEHVPRWFIAQAMKQFSGGVVRMLAGVLRLRPGLAFAGQFAAAYNLSRLWHALRAGNSREGTGDFSPPQSPSHES
jgi:glycosyltransferase involved in cell wall biosynthesis